MNTLEYSQNIGNTFWTYDKYFIVMKKYNH